MITLCAFGEGWESGITRVVKSERKMTDKRQKPWDWRKVPKGMTEDLKKKSIKWNEGGEDDIYKISIYGAQELWIQNRVWILQKGGKKALDVKRSECNKVCWDNLRLFCESIFRLSTV